jgi:hypothetical protein
MPIPKPKDGESKDDFIDRCMSDENTQKYPAEEGNNQRYAICISKWEEKNEGIDNVGVSFGHLLKNSLRVEDKW